MKGPFEWRHPPEEGPLLSHLVIINSSYHSAPGTLPFPLVTGGRRTEVEDEEEEKPA